MWVFGSMFNTSPLRQENGFGVIHIFHVQFFQIFNHPPTPSLQKYLPQSFAYQKIDHSPQEHFIEICLVSEKLRNIKRLHNKNYLILSTTLHSAFVLSERQLKN